MVAAAGAGVQCRRGRTSRCPAGSAAPARTAWWSARPAASQVDVGCTLTSITPGSGVTDRLVSRASGGGRSPPAPPAAAASGRRSSITVSSSTNGVEFVESAAGTRTGAVPRCSTTSAVVGSPSGSSTTTAWRAAGSSGGDRRLSGSGVGRRLRRCPGDRVQRQPQAGRRVPGSSTIRPRRSVQSGLAQPVVGLRRRGRPPSPRSTGERSPRHSGSTNAVGSVTVASSARSQLGPGVRGVDSGSGPSGGSPGRQPDLVRRAGRAGPRTPAAPGVAGSPKWAATASVTHCSATPAGHRLRTGDLGGASGSRRSDAGRRPGVGEQRRLPPQRHAVGAPVQRDLPSAATALPGTTCPGRAARGRPGRRSSAAARRARRPAPACAGPSAAMVHSGAVSRRWRRTSARRPWSAGRRRPAAAGRRPRRRCWIAAHCRAV